jgi:hypothetical protein
MAGRLIRLLMQSRTQAHIFHLNTPSFSRHKALQNYYEGIVPLLDSYAEAYMGRYGKLNMRNGGANRRITSTVGYFIALYNDIAKMKLPQDGPLKNLQDSIMELIASTVYKLRNLR